MARVRVRSMPKPLKLPSTVANLTNRKFAACSRFLAQSRRALRVSLILVDNGLSVRVQVLNLISISRLDHSPAQFHARGQSSIFR